MTTDTLTVEELDEALTAFRAFIEKKVESWGDDPEQVLAQWDCLSRLAKAGLEMGWRDISEAPKEHMFRCDLLVPGKGRMPNCTWSTAFDPPQWCQPWSRGDGLQGCIKVEPEPTHFFVPPSPPERGQ